MYMQGMNIDMKKMIGEQVVVQMTDDAAALNTEADSQNFMQTPDRRRGVMAAGGEGGGVGGVMGEIEGEEDGNEAYVQ